MIEIQRLKIELKKFNLLAENIKINQGEKIILSALNNSGKSIFLLGLTGLIKTQDRNVLFNGSHCDKNVWQNFTGVYHDQCSLIPFLTPSEYFNMVGNLKGFSSELVSSNARKYSDYLNFPKEKNKFIKEFSLGTQKKIGIIASLLGNPDIVLWDEPFTNLDDESGVSLALIIGEELKNTTVLFTSPNHDSPFNDFTSQLLIENGLVQKKIS